MYCILPSICPRITLRRIVWICMSQGSVSSTSERSCLYPCIVVLKHSLNCSFAGQLNLVSLDKLHSTVTEARKLTTAAILGVYQCCHMAASASSPLILTRSFVNRTAEDAATRRLRTLSLIPFGTPPVMHMCRAG